MYLEKRRSSPVFHCFKHGFAPLPDLWKLARGEVYINVQYYAINRNLIPTVFKLAMYNDFNP